LFTGREHGWTRIMMQALPPWMDAAGRSGLRLLSILLAALLLRRLLKAVTDKLVQAASSPTLAAKLREEHTRTLAGLLYSTGTVVIFAGALLTGLTEFNINVTPVAAAAGLASLGVGLGAQYAVRDLINGFFLVFEDQFVVGETIRVGEVTGRVEHLTLRRTLLRDANGALITIPNGEMRQVANLSRDWAQAHVDIPVPPSISVEQAIALLDEVATEMRADPSWGAAIVDGPRVLGVEELGTDGATLRLQVRTAPLRQTDVARELRRRVKIRLDQQEPVGARQRD
jgi:small conductance mechanosensitive channel